MLAGGVDTGLRRSARDAQVVGDLGVVQLADVPQHQRGDQLRPVGAPVIPARQRRAARYRHNDGVVVWAEGTDDSLTQKRRPQNGPESADVRQRSDVISPR